MPSSSSSYPRLLYVEKAMAASMSPPDPDEEGPEPDEEEGWGESRGSQHQDDDADDDDGDLDASEPIMGGGGGRRRRRRRRLLPVQLLVPSAKAAEGDRRNEEMMIGLPYSLKAAASRPSAGSTAGAAPQALSPLERAAAAAAATRRGPNDPPMALAAAAANGAGGGGVAAGPPPAPPAGGGLSDMMRAMGLVGRVDNNARAGPDASSSFKEVALVATPDPQEPFHVMAVRRLQALMCLAVLGQVLACAIPLFPPPGTTIDPSLVDPPQPQNGPHAPPSPFQQIDPDTLHAFAPLFGVGVAIACFGAAAALLRQPLGLKLYSLAAFLHLLCAAPLAPAALLPPALATVAAPIAMAERLYARIVPSCVVVSSGLVRRFS